MKNKLILSILACCSLFLWGCPYESEVGIDSGPSVKIDARLLGTWKSKGSSDDKFVCTKASDLTYKIEEVKKDGKNTIYSAFLSDVNGTTFMNAKEQGDGLSTNYYLYKVVVNSASSVTLVPVTENITEKFSSSAELKQFIEKNMGLSFFYDKSVDEYTKQ